MLMIEGIREGAVARDRAIAMLIIFAFNILFWMFFEQAGSSFTFLADKIVNRDLGGFVFPTAWFQSRELGRASSCSRRSWRGSGSSWRAQR